jgi:hypothetical protein
MKLATLIAVSVGLLTLAGCSPSSGPQYSAEQVFVTSSADGPRLTIVLAARWWREQWPVGVPAVDGWRAYAVDCPMPESDGPIGLPGAARVLDERPTGHYVAYVPLRDGPTWTRVDRSPMFLHNVGDVALLTPGAGGSRTEKPLARSADRSVGPTPGVHVISPRGSELLVVTATGATRYDLRSGVAGQSASGGPLVELRRTLVERRGHPGEWFGSDDLAYVVAVPTEGIHGPSGSISTDENERVPVSVAGTTLVLPVQAALYSTATGAVTAVPAVLEYPRAARAGVVFPAGTKDTYRERIWLRGVSEGREGPLLMYAPRYPFEGGLVVITDVAGRALFQCPYPRGTRDLFWRADAGQIVMLTEGESGPRHGSPAEAREIPYSVVIVDYRTGRRAIGTLDSGNVRTAVMAATGGVPRRP